MHEADRERRQREKDARDYEAFLAAQLRAQDPADLEALYAAANLVLAMPPRGAQFYGDQIYIATIGRKLKDVGVRVNSDQRVAFRISQTALDQVRYRLNEDRPLVLFLNALPQDDAEARSWRSRGVIGVDSRMFIPADDQYGVLMITPEVEAFLARQSQ